MFISKTNFKLKFFENVNEKTKIYNLKFKSTIKV